ncbi:hypothetical protein TNCV_2321191 [Trichonephila clavipes]|nr:hypothetical protein TNCV_2321191 [Trichonephila clavipes]
MAKHKSRKSKPTELTTDDEDMIMYDVQEEELEPDPEDKFAMKECFIKRSVSNSSTVASTSVLIERTASGTDQTKKVFDPERISVASGTPTPHGTPEHSVVNRCSFGSCQVIYSQFGLAIHQNDHQAKRRFVEWAQNEIAIVPDFHKRILFSDEAHFWLNGYVNKQNCRIWSEANPQVYVETPLHPEKLTVWCALWAGGILLQKR